jgi:hypothetical protein
VISSMLKLQLTCLYQLPFFFDDYQHLRTLARIIILASVHLEMTVAAITLEPTLFEGICMLSFASSDINVHLASLTVNNSVIDVIQLEVAIQING